MAVKAHSELGELLLASAGFIGLEAAGEYLEWRLYMASSMRAASWRWEADWCACMAA